jgi:hypothetical protein
MALANLTFTKKVGGTSRSVVIRAESIKEDYDNNLLIISPGKGDTAQGTDVTTEFSAARTKIKDRLRITHAVEISGRLAYDDTNTAEYMKNLLIEMQLYGKEGTSEFEVSLTGLKKVNSSGTVTDITLNGLISKITVTETVQGINSQNEVVYDVQIQFIEGGAKDGFLKNRFQDD